MNKYIYIVEVENKNSGDRHVSNEAFLDQRRAIDFVESRTGHPQRVDMTFCWESDTTIYRILDLCLV